MFNKIKKQAIPGIAVRSDKHTLRLLLASALLMAPAVQAATEAENTLTVTADTQESVTAPTKGIVAKESASGTKTATPLRKTPQSISVVTRDQMDDQAAASVSDALSYTSGVVTNYRGNSNRNDEVISRGFRYAPKFLDGLSYGLSGQAGAAGQIDPWLLERVEMVHGPASVLYGQVNPGGLINMTSKRPTAESIHEVKLSTGNQHFGEAAFDFGGQLNDDNTLFYRLNGIASTKHEFVKNNKQQRMAIAPAITWLPNEDTSFTLLTSYQNEPKAGYRNFLPMSGSLKESSAGYIPYDFNVSDPSYNEAKREQTSIGYIFDHNFNDAVSFQQNVRYSHMSESYKYLVYTWDADNDHSINRRPQHDKIMTDELAMDNQLKGKFETGDVNHTVIGGLDYKWSDVDSKLWRDSGDRYILDWANPTSIDIDESDFSLVTSTRKRLHQVGVYLQDQLEWNRWNLVLSGRNDWSEIRTLDRTDNSDTQQNDNKFTGRAGLLYAFDSGFSPYVSYSTSFEPNLSTGAPGAKPFAPTTGEQTEVGFKYQPTGTNTMLTVSWFDINQKNLTGYNSVLGYNEAIGKVNSKGVETELRSQPIPEVELLAQYTYTDAVTKESSTSSALAGRAPSGIPRHAASAWGNYSFLDGVLNGFTLGAGVRYTGDAPADSIGQDEVPHFTLYDAMVKYKLGEAVSALKGTTLQFNVQNLTDKHYVASCSNTEACFYGSGRTFVASVDYRW
ncbi:TonB-dependent siderophore receptor [Erwinia rhapontici]|uniref:TonB-dependent siderophore receptor n=1 Tax=Erwinia rhapontici TaxID=55212 RepID=UPI001D0DAF44|nr:TonB-dependent siderophore receptor [Erwinia rhapontici]UDQ81962.1 TonB-dependent siderophore receptor [Erwinia rhapontici]